MFAGIKALRDIEEQTKYGNDLRLDSEFLGGGKFKPEFDDRAHRPRRHRLLVCPDLYLLRQESQLESCEVVADACARYQWRCPQRHSDLSVSKGNLSWIARARACPRTCQIACQQ